MKQPGLYYFETIKMTSQAWSKFAENTRLRIVFSEQNLTRLVTSFLWFQNSIDQAVSQNKCQLYMYLICPHGIATICWCIMADLGNILLFMEGRF